MKSNNIKTIPYRSIRINLIKISLFFLYLALNHNALADSLSDKRLVREWRNRINVTNDSTFYKNVLTFPQIELTHDIWNNELLAYLKYPNLNVRKGLAFIIGQRHLYPSISIKALIEVLNTNEDSACINFLFALKAYGKDAIEPLLSKMDEYGPPYYLYKEDNSKNILCIEQDSASISSVWAMIALRFQNEGVLDALAKHSIKNDYLKVHLLEGLLVKPYQWDLYHQQVSEIEHFFKWHVDGSIDKMFYFKKLAQYSRFTAFDLIRKYDSSSIESLLNYIEDNKKLIHADTYVPDDWIVMNANSNSLNCLEYWLNEACVEKDKINFKYFGCELPQPKNTTEQRTLKSEISKALADTSDIKKNIPILYLLGNLGDSSRLFLKEIEYYTNCSSPKARYYAKRAIINSLMLSNKSYVRLSRKIFEPHFGDEYYNSLQEYLMLVGDDNKYFKEHPWQITERNSKKMQLYGTLNVGKIYFGISDRNIIRTSCLNWSFDTGNFNAISILRQFTHDTDKNIRIHALYALSTAEMIPPIKNIIRQLIFDSDIEIRVLASQVLIQTDLSSDPETRQAITAILLENAFNTRFYEELSHLSFQNDYFPYVYPKGPGLVQEFPSYPNPPPMPTCSGVIECKTLSEDALLNDLYDTLRTNLNKNGYSDYSTFNFEDGFALITRIERLKSDGNIDYDNRYDRSNIIPKTMRDYFLFLFYGDEGKYRGLSFLVCSKSNLQPFSKAPKQLNDYDNIYINGAQWIDKKISGYHIARRKIHMLVYEYSKFLDGSIQLGGVEDLLNFESNFKSLKLTSFIRK